MSTQSNGWQPIETAPKDGTTILLNYSGMKAIRLGWWDDDRFAKKPHPFFAWPNCSKASARGNPPTHWMPLPEPPKETP